MWRHAHGAHARGLGKYGIALGASALSAAAFAQELRSDQVEELVLATPDHKRDKLADEAAAWEDLKYERALRAARLAFKMPTETLQQLSRHFLQEARNGLAGRPSSLAMLPTYVTERVTGDERGDYFALDLGGTNFRVLRLTLEGDGRVGPITQAKFKISE